ncbi:MAG: alkaline phosphatase [Chloroflexaceae bacterium]|nr:alkaline phosphatase [Chloroflexaceae bacterium]
MDTYERMEQFARFVWEGRGQGLTRREFLKRGLALGLSLSTIGAVLVGCGVDQKAALSETAGATATSAATATPQATVTPLATSTATATPSPEPTETPLPTATPVPLQARFAVIGDFGWSGDAEAAVASLVKSWQPDFIVTTGDNNYPTGSAAAIDENVGQYYHEYMAHTGSAYGPGSEVNRFFPVLGNHDTDTDLGQPYFDYFVLPGNERYYLVDWPPVRIYAVNSVPWIEDDGVHPDSVQAEWLKRELAAANGAWNIVVFHHPPYGSGYKGVSTWMRWPFQEWGAHVVLNGHNHVYERIMINGFPYITNGAGGGPLYAFLDEIAEGSEVRYNMNHGAQLVQATEEQLSLQFITRNEEVIDTFVIERPLA